MLSETPQNPTSEEQAPDHTYTEYELSVIWASLRELVKYHPYELVEPRRDENSKVVGANLVGVPITEPPPSLEKIKLNQIKNSFKDKDRKIPPEITGEVKASRNMF